MVAGFKRPVDVIRVALDFYRARQDCRPHDRFSGRARTELGASRTYWVGGIPFVIYPVDRIEIVNSHSEFHPALYA